MNSVPAHPAQRGDIVVLTRIADGKTSVTLGVATSITRAGLVKAWDNPFLADSDPQSVPFRTLLRDEVRIASKNAIDVQGAMAAYREHIYPGHRQIEPFSSIDEARKFLRTFRVKQSNLPA